MYRNLRAVMVKHGLLIKDLADVCGLSLTSMNNKMNGHVEFNLTDIKTIVSFFVELGEDVTAELLFFTNVSA